MSLRENDAAEDLKEGFASIGSMSPEDFRNALNYLSMAQPGADAKPMIQDTPHSHKKRRTEPRITEIPDSRSNSSERSHRVGSEDAAGEVGVDGSVR